MKKKKEKDSCANNKKITRKEALKKATGLVGLTAASIIFLDTKASAQGSTPSAPPNW